MRNFTARAVENAERFSVAAFKRRLSAHVANTLQGSRYRDSGGELR